jgi:hypothetical protein
LLFELIADLALPNLEAGAVAVADNPRKKPAGRGQAFCFSVEAATGFEPVNNGFADRCLSHLAMPP